MVKKIRHKKTRNKAFDDRKGGKLSKAPEIGPQCMLKKDGGPGWGCKKVHISELKSGNLGWVF